MKSGITETEAHMKIKFNGEIHEVTDLHNSGYLPLLDLDDGSEWYIAETSEEAGEKAREYYQEMADNDPAELRCLVGDECLVNWAMGQHAGPGSESANSLDGWLDIVENHPEEFFASYDGTEIDVEVISGDLAEELGFRCFPGEGNAVAYRHN